MFYVRAVYKFHSTQPDEISLHVRDILLIDHVLDDNWYVGTNLRKSSGSFPINYVEKISLPTLNNNEKLFAAISDFSAPEPGDLKFCKGDIIRGLSSVDENWWKGIVVDSEDHELGIFPLTHVAELSNNYAINIAHNAHSECFKNDKVNETIIDMKVEGVMESNSFYGSHLKKGHKRSGSWYNQNNTKSLDSSVKPYAKTIYPYEANCSDELSFVDNEIVHLLEHHPSGWSRGKVDGKEGLFPTSYVEIIVDCSPSVKEIYSCINKHSSNVHRESTRSNRVSNFIAEEKELYGRALYHFSASSLDQIDLEEGDTVTILNKINENWYQAQHDDGRIGLCPSTYIEVFGAEPGILSPFSNQNLESSCDIQPQLVKPALQPKPSLLNKELTINFSNYNLEFVQMNGCPKGATSVSSESEPSQLNDINAELEDPQLLVDRENIKANELLGGKAAKLSPSTQSRPPLRPRKPPAKQPRTTRICVPSKFVPSRPAPSRPVCLTSDLIQFSPEHEKSLTNSNLVVSSTPPLPPLPPPKRSNQKFLCSNSDIKASVAKKPNYKPVIQSLPTPSESVKTDRKDKVLEELINTESDYCMSLELCRETFMEGRRSELCPSNIDLDGLFGNIDEIIALSHALRESFGECSRTPFMQYSNIGRCFLRLEIDFKRVYAPYCRNHDNVLSLLEKYEGNKEVQAFFRKMIDIMKESIIVFDLASILIKPVQRILKYPLLLSELDKCTDMNMPGKEDITSAMQCMANIASYINEFKRKQDLVSKYKQDTDEKLSDKIQKLNIHSTKKKLARFGQMIVGIQTVDEDFRREEQMFRSIENLTRNLIKNLNIFIGGLQESSFAITNFVEEVLNYYDDVSSDLEVDSMKSVFENITESTHNKFRMKVESEIVPHLSSLLIMFRGPSKVIKKRHDKLLDFENLTRQNAAIGDNLVKEEQNCLVKSNYEALNSQLIDELPKLNRLSLSILSSLLSRFLELKHLHQQEASSQMNKLGNLTFMASDNQDLKLNVAQQFNIGHTAAVDYLSHFSFIPLTFNPIAHEIKKSRRVTMDDSLLSKVDFNPSQDEAIMQKLLEIYPPEKLFKVTRYFAGSQAMDARLAEGSIVAVLKETDPMGNRERWYIDDASNKGFVLRCYLEPCSFKTLQCNPISPPTQCTDLLDDLESHDYTKHLNSNTINNSFDTLKHQLPSLFAQSVYHSSSNLQMLQSTHPFKQTPSTRSSYPRSESFTALSTNLSFSPTSSPLYAGDAQRLPVLQSASRDPRNNLGRNQKKVIILFDFHARSNLELNVSKNEIYNLIEMSDIMGNKDWWYLMSDEDDAKAGYVPANYATIIHT